MAPNVYLALLVRLEAPIHGSRTSISQPRPVGAIQTAGLRPSSTTSMVDRTGSAPKNLAWDSSCLVHAHAGECSPVSTLSGGELHDGPL